MKNFNNKRLACLSFPKFSVGNLNDYRSPTKNFGDDKLMYLILITLILFIAPLFSQEEVREINYQSIKQTIQSGNLDRALKDVEDLLKENPGDATLALYQAEIWLDKGEKLYQKRKYKSAFIEFGKVYKVWSNHAFVRQRYNELKDKSPLMDYQEEKSKPISLVPIGLQGTGNPQVATNDNQGIAGEVNVDNPKPDEELTWKSLAPKEQILYKHIIRLENLMVITVFILGIINISLLYTISKKK